MTETETQHADDALFTLAGVSKVLPIHKRTVYTWVADGSMPPHDAIIMYDGRPQKAWKASTLRQEWASRRRRRELGERSWRNDVVRTAQINVVEGAYLQGLPRIDGVWIDGKREGTRELIVRYIELIP